MATPGIRARVRLGEHGRATVRTLITHPMLPEQVDAASGTRTAPHIIEEVDVTLNGEPVLTLACGQGMSANPLLTFALDGVSRGDEVGIGWRDNQGHVELAHFSVE